MLQDFNQRLALLIQQRRLKQKHTRSLIAVENDLAEKSARLRVLNSRVKKEKIDVDKLEGTTLTNLFHSVLGSRDQQLDKERQELLAVQLQYQQTKNYLESLEQARDQLLKELDDSKNVDSDYKAILLEKEEFLKQSNHPSAQELVELSEQIAKLHSERNEITEAIEAGNSAILSLEKVIESLKSAEGWGVWDMLGGGLLSTAVKHSRIDDARYGIYDVQSKIDQFKRELADIYIGASLQIDIGQFESFADFFFDGLIFDWVVQSKIVQSLDRCLQLQGKIVETVRKLELQRQTVQGNIKDLVGRRTQLIEQA